MRREGRRPECFAETVGLSESSAIPGARWFLTWQRGLHDGRWWMVADGGDKWWVCWGRRVVVCECRERGQMSEKHDMGSARKPRTGLWLCAGLDCGRQSQRQRRRQPGRKSKRRTESRPAPSRRHAAGNLWPTWICIAATLRLRPTHCLPFLSPARTNRLIGKWGRQDARAVGPRLECTRAVRQCPYTCQEARNNKYPTSPSPPSRFWLCC